MAVGKGENSKRRLLSPSLSAYNGIVIPDCEWAVLGKVRLEASGWGNHWNNEIVT